MTENIKYWIWLSSLVKVPPVIRYELYDYFKCPERIWQAPAYELNALPFMDKQTVDHIFEHGPREQAQRSLEKLGKMNINVVLFTDGNYPENLKNIFDPPLVLYTKGKLLQQEQQIAVVGSRHASRYGLEMAEKLSCSLSQAGLTITSGMARGIDSKAHTGALRAAGRTIAVLGCGVDVVYPSENKELMKKISETGVVISEYLPGTPPSKFNFPARNRIISGMSLGTVIIEASEKSGSLITANYALEQGREVFALPGNIDSKNSAGTNRLIRDGAKIVLDIGDILEELNVSKIARNKFYKRKRISKAGLEEDEMVIVRKLMNAPMHIDSIADSCDMNVSTVGSILVMLELKGIIEQMPGKIYCLKN